MPQASVDSLLHCHPWKELACLAPWLVRGWRHTLLRNYVGTASGRRWTQPGHFRAVTRLGPAWGSDRHHSSDGVSRFPITGHILQLKTIQTLSCPFCHHHFENVTLPVTHTCSFVRFLNHQAAAVALRAHRACLALGTLRLHVLQITNHSS